jgi:hypothetical protein
VSLAQRTHLSRSPAFSACSFVLEYIRQCIAHTVPAARYINTPNNYNIPMGRYNYGGATKEQTEYIEQTARYKYKSLIYESD